MALTMRFAKRTAFWFVALTLVYVVPTLANPNNYPQFAQQQVDPAIPIFFAGVEHLKTQLDAGQQLTLVDVRSTEEYRAGHIPGAKSIPLEELPRRMTEIPRDTPVVLY